MPNWKAFLELALTNVVYAKQLLALFPMLPARARAALEVIFDHISKHADCIVELAEKLSTALVFGSGGEQEYSEALQPIAAEINTVRMTSSAFGESRQMMGATEGEAGSELSDEVCMYVYFACALEVSKYITEETPTLREAVPKFLEARPDLAAELKAAGILDCCDE